MGIKRKACPRCRQEGRDRSGDNLALYPDGHAYCYACGYRESPTVENTVKQAILTTDPPPMGSVVLPDDFTKIIPETPASWLRQFNLTKLEIEHNNIGWSETNKLLIFPVYGEAQSLCMWQGRNFRVKRIDITNTSQGVVVSRGSAVVRDGPKYLTKGNVTDTIHVIEPPYGVHSNTIIAVEGVVDAIKVGRVAPAIPLWGSKLHSTYLRYIADKYERLGIWLDADKLVDGIKTALWASQFIPTFVVKSTSDPKSYHTDLVDQMIIHHKLRTV